MYGRQTVYLAEPALTSSDGRRYRIVKDTEGAHADLAPDEKEHVLRLNEQQAKRLRDSLNEVLVD